MPPLSPFNSPHILGFDELETMLDAIGKAGNEGFPPYNIEQTGDLTLRITLALAGYQRSDLDLEIIDRQLVIKGQGDNRDDTRNFLHRGIAARQFVRKFLLADGLEVTGAKMEHGLLHIDIERPEPDTISRRITIA